MSSNLEKQCLIDTYNLLKSKGGVQDYVGFDKAQSSFNQKTNMQILPNSIIKTPENIAQRLIQIHEITELEGKEIPFFIFAHDGRNNGNENEIIIDEIVFSEEDLNLQVENAYYGPQIVNLLNQRIQKYKNDPSFLIIQGHSHPSFRGNIANMYSIQDLANIVYLNKQTSIQFGACVVTPDGKINMCFYDANSNNFYKAAKFQVTPAKQNAITVLNIPNRTRR